MLNRYRNSTRLVGFDYCQVGWYYLTLCCQGRAHRFGEIKDAQMMLNASGMHAAQCWRHIPDHFPNAQLDTFVIMPDHMHGIIQIVGANNHSPFGPSGTSRTIGSMVRGFKCGVSVWFRQNGDQSQIWQRNYWERVIRDDLELQRIRQYITDNPKNWAIRSRGE
jgi:REP element-mobilizing transposase RayT